MKYRKEIDGLRALAVIPVILFHAGFSCFNGGFIGVDVFFVISGYLITTIIINELSEGTFSLLNFYERRARRILPALFFVTLIWIPFAWVLFTPSDLKDFGQSLLAVATFSSNILFWHETSYFGTDSEIKPLLHTWSLAVEEQYYILFPLFLLFFWRFGKKSILIFLGLIFTISIGVAHWGAYNNPTPTFYLLPTRGWELILGVFTAFYLQKNGFLESKLLNQSGSLLGFALIVFSIIAFDDKTPFPSFYALIPTLGTALLIITAVKSTWIQKLLSFNPIVGLGLISYSAYLWHQPILAFFRNRASTEFLNLYLIALCIISIILAFFSWNFIEKPFRDKTLINRKTMFKFSFFGVLTLLIVGTFLTLSDGALYKYSSKDRDILSLFINPNEYTTKRFNEHLLINFDENSSKKILLIGDSSAQDLTNAIYESNLIDEFSLSTYHIPNYCGNLFLEKELIQDFQSIECRSHEGYSNQSLMDLMIQSDEIWLQSSWLEWQLPLLKESLSNLKDYSQSKILVFGRKSFGEINQSQYFSEGGVKNLLRERNLPRYHILISEEMSRSVPNFVEYIDVSILLCDSYKKCSNSNDENYILSYDGRHLTPHGAIYFGNKLKEYLKKL
jgi:peptidoglycan/LPS O-acetylase OafA/YrhL